MTDRTQKYGRGSDSNFDTGERHAEQTQHSSEGHHHGKRNGQYPDGGRTELCAPKSDSNHGNNVVETGNGMFQAAEEAHGFSFMDVSLRRLDIKEEREQQNCEDAWLIPLMLSLRAAEENENPLDRPERA